MGGRGGSGGASQKNSEYRDVMSRLPDAPRMLDFYAMPKLQGTEKQVQWANKIREEVVMDLAYYANDYTSDGRQNRLSPILAQGKKAMADSILTSAIVSTTSGKLRQEKINDLIHAYTDTADRWNRLVSLVEGHTSASFWIDNRTNQLKNYLNKKLKAYIDGK